MYAFPITGKFGRRQKPLVHYHSNNFWNIFYNCRQYNKCRRRSSKNMAGDYRFYNK